MKVIKFIAFKNSDEFEQWQRDEERLITAIQPIPQSINFDTGENSIGGVVDIQVIVTYVEDEDVQEI